MLETEHALTINADELVDLVNVAAASPDASPVFERLTREAAEVKGFAVVDRVVIGNFSYAKFLMVKDLEAATDTLLENELICAIAVMKRPKQSCVAVIRMFAWMLLIASLLLTSFLSSMRMPARTT